MSSHKSITFLLLLFVGVKSGNCETGLPCELSWVTSGNGEFVKYKINGGVNNCVARIARQSPGQVNYFGGYANERNGKAYALNAQEEILESEIYSVI